MNDDFVPGEPAPAGAGTDPQIEGAAPAAPEPSQPNPDPSQPEPSGFVFAGRTFATQAEAEAFVMHNLKSQAGRIRAFERRLAESATAPQPQTPQPAPPENNEPQSGFDQTVYDELAAKYGRDAAERYRVDENLKHQRALTDYRIERELAPLREAREAQEIRDRTANLFSQARDVKDPSSGQLLFPEFQSPEASRAVLEIWNRFHPEHALTPAGIRDAVMIYRGSAFTAQTRAGSVPPSRPAPSGGAIPPSPGGSPAGTGRPAPVLGLPRSLQTDALTGERF